MTRLTREEKLMLKLYKRMAPKTQEARDLIKQIESTEEKETVEPLVKKLEELTLEDIKKRPINPSFLAKIQYMGLR